MVLISGPWTALGGALVLLFALPPAATGQCEGEEWPDFGFGWVGSAEGLRSIRHEGRDYTGFDGPPVVHQTSGDPGGFQDADTIVAIDGMRSDSRAAAIAFGRPEARPVEFRVRRAGEVVTLRITPVIRCRSDGRTERLSWLGLAVTCESCEATLHSGRFRSWRFRSPPSVVNLDPSGPAKRAGFETDDRIVSVDGFPITSPEATRALGAIRPGSRVVFEVRRGASVHTLVVVVGPHAGATPEGPGVASDGPPPGKLR